MIQQRRGKNVALAGAFFQLVFTAVMLVIWLWTRSAAAMSCLWFLIGGLGVWLMAALLLYCRQIERRESLELEEIAAGGGADGTIFAGDAEREMRVAARRLRIVERWGVPLFALFWAAYHVATGLLMLQYLRTHQGATIQAAGEGALFLVLIAFLAFLFSFYALGMGRRPQWRVLRAAGSYVLINVLLIAAVAGNLLAAWQGYSGADRALACAIPALQLIFALELAANVILDLYRPRVPGQEERFSFDSRIFGLIADPQRVGTSIAETLNYQFGFEVSRTWFYRLVSRAFVPLVLFGLVVLVGLSSVLVVREGEAFVVQRWGRADPARGALGPGLHLKWPWPIETTTRFNVGKVWEVRLGAGRRRSADDRRENFVRRKPGGRRRELYLWTAAHGSHEELDFLVAAPRRIGGSGPTSRPSTAEGIEGAPAVNIIKLVVSVEYTIANPYDYGFRYVDARAALENVAYREMTAYCASATLHEVVDPTDTDRPQAILSSGRGWLAAALKRRIAAVAERMKLGVAIQYVGILAAHPPPDAAPAYEKVLEAERRVQERRYQAEAVANGLLSAAAGDRGLARTLAFRIRVLSDLNRLQNARGAGAEFPPELARLIGARRKDVAWLQEQVGKERLLGRGRNERETADQQLLKAYQSHLAELESIREAADAGDFSARIVAARASADAWLARAGGAAAVLVENARARRWDKALEESRRAVAFSRQLLPYHACPEVYRRKEWLDVWDQVLPDAHKYVLGVPREQLEIRWNLERRDSPLGQIYDDQEGKSGP